MIKDGPVSKFHNLIADLAVTSEMEHAIAPPIVDVTILFAGMWIREDENIRRPSRGFDPALSGAPVTLV